MEAASDFSDFNGLDHLFLAYGQTIHQPPVLLRCKFLYIFVIPRPLEFSIRQPFIQKQPAIAFIKKCLDSICSTSTEKKDISFFKRVQLKSQFNDFHQRIDSLAQIRIIQELG